MLDLHPASNDQYRLWSHKTSKEGSTQVHTDKDTDSSISRKRKRQ